MASRRQTSAACSPACARRRRSARRRTADPERRGQLAPRSSQSAEGELCARLGRERVDVLPAPHRRSPRPGGDGTLDVQAVIEEGRSPAFEALRQQGKIRFYGFSGTGERPQFRSLIEAGAFDVFQVIYNILNPSAGEGVPSTRSRTSKACSTRDGAGRMVQSAFACSPVAREEASRPARLRLAKRRPDGNECRL